MNKTIFKNIALLLALCVIFSACHRNIPENLSTMQAKAKVSKTRYIFGKVKDIKYTEAKRLFSNGLSFAPDGYRLVPSWRLSFPSTDSVNIYNPRRKVFNNAPVMFDHDSIFNIAFTWLRLKKLTKDSLKFQVLKVENLVIVDLEPQVDITFYSDNYIKNVLHTDTGKLWRANRKDTAYIKKKVAWANSIPDSAFAATQPAIIKSKSPLVRVVKRTAPKNDVNGMIPEDDYLLPEYDIAIKNAYDNFIYSFNVWIDEKGTIIFRKSLDGTYPEFKKQMLEAMQGITDGYLKLYLAVTPGKTLDMPHKSIVVLHVRGTKK